MKREEDIQHLYRAYNTVIKPLIAEVEARTEQFPLPLFNEIRALHDHISRCYCEVHGTQMAQHYIMDIKCCGFWYCLDSIRWTFLDNFWHLK